MNTTEKIGRCSDCTAPQTEANMLSRHILELQADKGKLIDRVRELERENAELKSEKGCESCTKFDEVQLIEAKEIIRIMRHLLFDVWGYIAIPLEKRVNAFLKDN